MAGRGRAAGLHVDRAGLGLGRHPARLATAADRLQRRSPGSGWRLYGVETWTRRGEAFAVYFNLLSRLAIFEKRGHEIGVRPPLGGLPSLERPPGIVAFVCVMIGTSRSTG